MTLLRPIGTQDRANPTGRIFLIYPSSLKRVRVANLGWPGTGTGIELFEFQDPKMEPGTEASFERDYTRGGPFHVALRTGDLDGALKRMVNGGGKQIGAMVPLGPNHEACYVEDPWGNVIELLSANFEQIVSEM